MDDTLRKMIGQADDDYLIGLCNKGTVKRAYKDLAQEEPSVTWKGEGAEVTLKEETCLIRLPLGESTCSCPSRSICRHIVTAVLWLKQETGKEITDAGTAEPEAPAVRCEASEQKAVEEPEGEGSSGQPGTGPVSEDPAAEEPAEPKLLEEILQIPVERLKRACRGKRYLQFLARLRAGDLPSMEESSIVTVTLPWEKAVVKLLEPFAYSTCTCHSRELCVHKAQAVLAYQLAKGRITLQDLDGLKEAENEWDVKLVQKVCEGICGDVEHQVCTGLSRQSPEISESLERLAVISHRAELPSLETRLREASSEYRQYFERSAAFRTEALLQKLLGIHELARKLRDAGSQEQIRAIAGTFRDIYEPVGQLRLLGMGGRTFSSKTGYEGEIYYFLEPEQKRIYTWTDARPVFYEGIRRRPPGGGNAMAPWGLNCSREQLQSLEFDLADARAASGGRLSVSRDSKGEAVGERSLLNPAVREWIFWDYEALLEEHFGGRDAGQELLNRASGRREKLVLAGAVRWDETCFDTVEQRFSWNLYDVNGCRLSVALKYTKEEKLTIQLLERLERRLKKRSRKAIVFFGSVYLNEEGRLCLYPIEFFIKEAEEIAGQEGWTAWYRTAEGSAEQPADRDLPSAEILFAMEHYRKEAVRQLSDLFVSGLYSAREDLTGRLSVLAEDGERMGLHHAGSMWKRICRELEDRRHQMEFSPEPVIRAAGELHAYFRACQEKLAYDTARRNMRQIVQEEEKNNRM
ncbi:MAG: hypothetical protein HFI15_00530 [Lachnospiraceae bacterium]|nr:hypothetical protein [Lachnospiraceae bacterium]